MSDRPECDVVIPVFNGADFVRDAIDSALAQTGVAVSVWVVDAGSTDGTVEIVRSINDARVELQSGEGRLRAGAARNRGARLGSAPWLSFLDADDLWPRDRTKDLLASVVDPATDIVVGHVLAFEDEEPALDAPLQADGTPRALLAGGVLFSRALFESVGAMLEDLRAGEFIEWLMRARRAGAVERTIPEVTLLRRSHPHNTTRNQPTADYLQMVARIRAVGASHTAQLGQSARVELEK